MSVWCIRVLFVFVMCVFFIIGFSLYSSYMCSFVFVLFRDEVVHHQLPCVLCVFVICVFFVSVCSLYLGVLCICVFFVFVICVLVVFVCSSYLSSSGMILCITSCHVCVHVQRALYVCQKSPICMSKKPCVSQKNSIYTSKEPYIYVKRALYTRQQKPCMHPAHAYMRIRQKSLK